MMPAKEFERCGDGGADRILRGLTAPSQVHLLGRRQVQCVPQDMHGSDSRAALGAKPGAAPVASVLQEACDSGRREGFEQGMRQAREMAAREQQALSDKLAQEAAAKLEAEAGKARETAQKQVAEQFGKQFARLKNLVDALPAQIDSRMDACVEDMLALCMDILGRCFGSQARHPQQIASWIRSALQEMRARPVVAVHLHPDDLAAIEQAQTVLGALNEQFASSDQGASVSGRSGQTRVQWVGDPAVQLGGCVLKSPEGGLDARMETRLRLIADALQRTRAGQVASARGQP